MLHKKDRSRETERVNIILSHILIAKPSLLDILLLMSLITRSFHKIEINNGATVSELRGLRTKYRQNVKDVWPVFKIRGSVNLKTSSLVLTAVYVVASQKKETSRIPARRISSAIVIPAIEGSAINQRERTQPVVVSCRSRERAVTRTCVRHLPR